jgi:hypothetical protein
MHDIKQQLDRIEAMLKYLQEVAASSRALKDK